MSYAIIRNAKHTRGKVKAIYKHNERRNKNYSNKNIDLERIHLNYSLKNSKLSYEREFDRLREENDLKGQIKTTSIISCEYIITSDNKFFNEIGEEDTERYFETAYDFICKYKDLGKENIISAVVHMDEETPHMHLTFIPVVHTKDKAGKDIDKVSESEFWQGRDSYRKLQDAFYGYVKEHGFELERGEPSGRENLSVEEYKKVTNFEELKKNMEPQQKQNEQILSEEKIKLDNIPKIKINRDETIQQKIIKPLEEQNKTLLKQNQNLQNDITKVSNIIKVAEKIEEQNKELEKENREMYREVNILKYRNEFLERVVNTLQSTMNKFVKWICNKFAVNEKDIVKDFEQENNIYLDPVEQIEKEDYLLTQKQEEEWD